MSTPSPASKAPAAMPDVQGSEDSRNVPIDKVGVKDIRYPIALHCPKSEGKQHTVAMVNMYVALPHYQKGTHMSRFLEVLNKHHQGIDSGDVMQVARDMKQRLEAEEAHLEMTFPYFIDKEAPVTKQPGKLDIAVTFEAVAGETDDFILGIKVPATSLCPCSKKISDYGAHNQRCEMEAQVRFAPGKMMWIEELFDLVEQCASTQVFAVLKRPDEKFVTEAAFDNPKFVEDIVRDLAVALDAEDRISWFRVASENFESIHNHNAYAVLERDKR
ncbi:GTP cyclohydrolase FolE2 [Phycisphaeraceae bacterium D3-23]